MLIFGLCFVLYQCSTYSKNSIVVFVRVSVKIKSVQAHSFYSILLTIIRMRSARALKVLIPAY